MPRLERREGPVILVDGERWLMYGINATMPIAQAQDLFIGIIMDFGGTQFTWHDQPCEVVSGTFQEGPQHVHHFSVAVAGLVQAFPVDPNYIATLFNLTWYTLAVQLRSRDTDQTGLLQAQAESAPIVLSEVAATVFKLLLEYKEDHSEVRGLDPRRDDHVRRDGGIPQGADGRG
jgi:hypothetical protein